MRVIKREYPAYSRTIAVLVMLFVGWLCWRGNSQPHSTRKVAAAATQPIQTARGKAEAIERCLREPKTCEGAFVRQAVTGAKIQKVSFACEERCPVGEIAYMRIQQMGFSEYRRMPSMFVFFILPSDTKAWVEAKTAHDAQFNKPTQQADPLDSRASSGGAFLLEIRPV